MSNPLNYDKIQIMNTIDSTLSRELSEFVEKMHLSKISITLMRPEFSEHGDYATGLPMQVAKQLKKNPIEIAESLKKFLDTKKIPFIDRIEVAKPGFVNIFLNNKALIDQLLMSDDLDTILKSLQPGNKKVMVEYAHPNTHKEMHIGHMRTLITGESVARILEAVGVDVFRANYQGDIGMHVAKALYGIGELLKKQNQNIEDIATESHAQKAHFLGTAYALGSSLYETQKEEIDRINTDLYKRTGEYWDLYEKTRQWSLDYYEDFYRQFYTQFDRLFFESEMADEGTRIVREHIGTIFHEDNGAVIFRGEDYGLHTRVFITQKGTPTYEAKDIANAYKQYETFAFDQNIHVVASEQAGYFQVVIKALELLDPEKFKGSEFHLSMGMVQLKDRKMSSRTGDVFTVDSLIDQVRDQVEKLFADGKVGAEQKSDVVEKIVIGAIKYSVLKVNTGQNASFDIDTSVSLDGNSSPYLQYTYARTQSVLGKSEESLGMTVNSEEFTPEERLVLRTLMYFPEIVRESAEELQPSVIANYLYDLAQKYNLFYQKNKIIGSEQEQFRLSITHSVATVLQKGLFLLGIKTVDKM